MRANAPNTAAHSPLPGGFEHHRPIARQVTECQCARLSWARLHACVRAHSRMWWRRVGVWGSVGWHRSSREQRGGHRAVSIVGMLVGSSVAVGIDVGGHVSTPGGGRIVGCSVGTGVGVIVERQHFSLCGPTPKAQRQPSHELSSSRSPRAQPLPMPHSDQ